MIIFKCQRSGLYRAPVAVHIHAVRGPRQQALPAVCVCRLIVLRQCIARRAEAGTLAYHTRFSAQPEARGCGMHESGPVRVHPRIPVRRIKIKLRGRVIKPRLQGSVAHFITVHSGVVAVVFYDAYPHGHQYLGVVVYCLCGLCPECLKARPCYDAALIRGCPIRLVCEVNRP